MNFVNNKNNISRRYDLVYDILHTFSNLTDIFRSGKKRRYFKKDHSFKKKRFWSISFYNFLCQTSHHRCLSATWFSQKHHAIPFTSLKNTYNVSDHLSSSYHPWKSSFCCKFREITAERIKCGSRPRCPSAVDAP